MIGWFPTTTQWVIDFPRSASSAHDVGARVGSCGAVVYHRGVLRWMFGECGFSIVGVLSMSSRGRRLRCSIDPPWYIVRGVVAVD